MAIKYPNMFEDVGSCDAGNQFGYGLGGKMGNKFLDKHLVERVSINSATQNPTDLITPSLKQETEKLISEALMHRQRMKSQ